MARPGKSIEAKLEIVNAKIEKVEAQLKSLKDERKALEDQKGAEQVNELLILIKEKNLSVSDVIGLIEQNQNATEVVNAEMAASE